MTYRAPLTEMSFVFDRIVELNEVVATDRFSDAQGDVATAILGEAAKMATDVLSPLQRVGDNSPAYLENGVVRCPPGYGDGFRAIAEGGWIGMSAGADYGGMALPLTLTTAVNEMMNGACLSLALNPLMSQGQIEALQHHASDDIKAIYLPKLISGEWCGTMNLTEAQAGSDVGALRSKAVANDDGSYAVSGQKIFISWADNDFSANVCHLVLARLPDGQPGTKGISLFLVPKYLPDDAGNPGVANSLNIISLEHKMGLHGSPTALLEFDGATGWLVGEAHQGMVAMFTMMNNARLGVGVQGLGVAEAAYQQAASYALERRQGRAPIEGGTGAIVDHADVRRMLLTMKSQVFAARSICYSTAVALDMATATGQPEWHARAAFLTPIAKAFGTDTGINVAEMAMQVHGGMGYIEETGVAQYYRDVRVTAIYEGTNGVQAMDLVGRKLADGGAAAYALLDEITDYCAEVDSDGQTLGDAVGAAAAEIRATTDWLVAQENVNARFAGAAPYLRGLACLLGGYFHLKAARSDTGGDREALANFYMANLLPAAAGHCAAAKAGEAVLYAISADALAE